MAVIIPSLGDDDPKRANVHARLIEPDGEKLLQVDIYEPSGREKSGRRAYRIYLTQEAVRQMMTIFESKV